MNKEIMIAKAIETDEGKEMIWEAIKPGIEEFRDKYFSKWNKERQKAWIKAAFGV